MTTKNDTVISVGIVLLVVFLTFIVSKVRELPQPDQHTAQSGSANAERPVANRTDQAKPAAPQAK